jgi:hypothetical protein
VIGLARLISIEQVNNAQRTVLENNMATIIKSGAAETIVALSYKLIKKVAIEKSKIYFINFKIFRFIFLGCFVNQEESDINQKPERKKENH